MCKNNVERNTFQIKEYHECGQNTLKLLIGNKSDLRDSRQVRIDSLADNVPYSHPGLFNSQVSEDEGRAKAASINASFIATSAKVIFHVMWQPCIYYYLKPLLLLVSGVRLRLMWTVHFYWLQLNYLECGGLWNIQLELLDCVSDCIADWGVRCLKLLQLTFVCSCSVEPANRRGTPTGTKRHPPMTGVQLVLVPTTHVYRWAALVYRVQKRVQYHGCVVAVAQGEVIPVVLTEYKFIGIIIHVRKSAKRSQPHNQRRPQLVVATPVAAKTCQRNVPCMQHTWM